MISRKLDEFDDRAYYLEVLAKSESSRRMTRIVAAMAQQRSNADQYPMAETPYRTLAELIITLRDEAERAGIPATDLSDTAIAAWVRGNIPDRVVWRVWESDWN